MRTAAQRRERAGQYQRLEIAGPPYPALRQRNATPASGHELTVMMCRPLGTGQHAGRDQRRAGCVTLTSWTRREWSLRRSTLWGLHTWDALFGILLRPQGAARVRTTVELTWPVGPSLAIFAPRHGECVEAALPAHVVLYV